MQSRTVRRPEEADAAVLALPDGSALATSIDGNGRRVAADPYTGAIGNVLECAANLACVGAEPLGITNNLNFGNPEKPHIAWQLTEAVRGLGDACRALDVPVVGGNVSLYNEGADGPIYPTPVIGMVGELPDARRAAPSGFATEGDASGLAGWNRAPSLAGSELAKLRGEALPDGLPAFDLEHCARVLDAIRDAVRAGDLASCHDVAEGGFLVAVAEACLYGGIGATSHTGGSGFGEELLFGEEACGFVVSGERAALEALAERIPLDVFGDGRRRHADDRRVQLDAGRAADGPRRAGVAVSLATDPRRRCADDQLDTGLDPERRRVQHEVVVLRAARVAVVELADVGGARGVGLLHPLGRLAAIDRLDRHRLAQARLLAPVEADVQRAGVLAQHHRARAAEHDDLAEVGGLVDQALGLALEERVLDLGQHDAAQVGHAGEHPDEPAAGAPVLRVDDVDVDVQSRGDLDGDRPVDEVAVQALGHRRTDPAATGAVGGRDRDDGHARSLPAQCGKRNSQRSAPTEPARRHC